MRSSRGGGRAEFVSVVTPSSPSSTPEISHLLRKLLHRPEHRDILLRKIFENTIQPHGEPRDVHLHKHHEKPEHLRPHRPRYEQRRDPPRQVKHAKHDVGEDVRG